MGTFDPLGGMITAMETLAIPWTTEMRRVLAQLQQRALLRRVQAFAARSQTEVFVVGGTVRDVCLGHDIQDVDLALAGDVMGFARAFAKACGGAYVPMDEEVGEARVVYRKRDIVDFSRLKGADIIEDLGRRDFTINALACPLTTFLTAPEPRFLDPYGGWQDLRAGVVRVVSPRSFHDDPLRMLRAFRFAATLAFRIEASTLESIKPTLWRLVEMAVERIHSEVLQLFAATHSRPHLVAMAQLGLLDVLFPELAATRGMVQTPGHSEDVFEHAILTYGAVEDLIRSPASYAPAIADLLATYAHRGERTALLKWAALLHGIGKPLTGQEGAGGQVPLVGYTERGAELWERVGSRLKLSRARTAYVKTLIAHQRHPVDLARLEAQQQLPLSEVLCWFKELGEDVLGTFVLAIGDAVASHELDTPAKEVMALGDFAARLWDLYRQRILPVISAPRLVTGNDLQQVFGLAPGPRFKTLLDALEVAQVEGRIQTRDDALQWVEAELQRS